MKVTLESTSRIVQIEVNGVSIPARLWEGTTEKGVACVAMITRIGAHAADDQSEFERDLIEHKAPTEISRAFDIRYFLD